MRTYLQSPGWTWEAGEVLKATFPQGICEDSGWTYFCHQVLLICHPHGHCFPPLPPSSSKDLLGLTDLRFRSVRMFEGTSCWVTVLWHLLASHGRRSLVGCCPWGHEESDLTEQLHFHFSFSCIGEGNGNPLQCSCLENPRDGGVWWAAVYGVTQSRI